MDVQKYIKRLKFARADMSRSTGFFETRDEAINFLNSREFFFGDPFIVKYNDRDDENKTKLMLAIGKSENPTVTSDTTEVSGATGPEAYELFDVNGIKDLLEQLREDLEKEVADREAADQVLQDNIDAEASARTEADEHLQEQIDEISDAIDAINGIIGELSGATESLEEIVGEGWTDSPDNVTITDRIKRDEELAGIVWGHNDGEPYDGHLPNTELPYASGESIADMVKTISGVLDGVLFEDDDVTKAIKFEYNAERNILYYTAGTQTGAIELSQASVVERAYYDAETEELVIIFNLGEGKQQEVRIPVAGLITEWDVENTNTVELAKTRVVEGKDIITASVKVSDDADNMLTAKSDGLYVSNSAVTELAEVVANVKEDIGALEDGHLPADYFSGSTINGSTNLQEALLKLDDKIVEDEAKHDEDITAVRGEIAQLSDSVDSAMTEVDGAINLIAGNLADEVVARESIKLVELPQQELDADVRAAYVLDNNGVTGDTVIKIYKDSVIYKVYIGHVDDRITSPTDPTVIDGTGETAVCFIYFNANGEYELTANPFKWTALDDEIAARIAGDEQLQANIDAEASAREAADEQLQANIESEASTREAADEQLRSEIASAVAGEASARTESEAQLLETLREEMGEGAAEAKTEVALDENAEHILLEKTTDPVDNHDVYTISETNIASQSDLDAGMTGLNIRCDMLQTQIDEEKGYRKSIKLKQLSQAQVEELFGSDTNVLDAYYLVDHHNYDPSMSDTIVKVYKDSVTVADMDSFDLEYDHDNQEIVLSWMAGGHNNSSHIDVSDFIKDSFLKNVQVVTHDGVQCLEFTFQPADGPAETIYVPLSDFAVIYSAGDGIDARELADNQVITVKIDPMHEGENSWLAKSDAGLRVTGITEYIDERVDEKVEEAIDTLDNVYVRKDEVESTIDSSSTNPVQSRAIYDALQNIEVDVDDHLDSASTNAVENRVVTDAINGINDRIDGIETNLSDNYYDKSSIDQMFDEAASATTEGLDELAGLIAAEAAARSDKDDELEGLIEALSGNTDDLRSALDAEIAARKAVDGQNGDSYVANAGSEYISGATSLNDADVKLDAALKDAESARTEADNELWDALNAEISARTEGDTYLQEQIDNLSAFTASTIYADEYQNLPTATTTDFGVVIVDDHLDSASTNPVENQAIYKVITDNEEVTAAALNDLNDRKSDKSDLDDAISSITNYINQVISGISFDIDDQLDSASTNPLENRAIYEIINNIEEAIETLSGGGLTGVTTTGSGNVITAITKNGMNVQATFGNIDVSGKLDTTVFDSFTASTLNDVSANTGSIVIDVTKDGDKVKVTKSDELSVSGFTANTISATTYQNLPSATTGDSGVVIVDDHLDSASTNPVENQVLYQIIHDNELVTAAALNDLNDRKANKTDIPVSITDLVGGDNLATKTDLAGYLPLSGGTMTGNISGSTGNAIYMPGGFFQQSDESLKIFMGDIENALDKANKIPTKYFFWKDRYDGPRELGTSAQKVQEFFPEIVSGEDKLSVDYSKLAIVALAAIKELTAKVEDLQNQLDELKK